MAFIIEDGVLRKYTHEEGETKVTVLDGVTIIDSYVFKDCENLVSVVLPEGLKEINEEAFSGCKNLRSIKFPDSLTYIEYGAFLDCESLGPELEIPELVWGIGDEAFENCTRLATLRINNPEIRLFCDFLYGCVNLTDVYVKGLNAYDRMLSCVDTEKVNIYVDGVLSDHSDDWNWNIQNDWDGILDFYRNNREKWLAEINSRKNA